MSKEMNIYQKETYVYIDMVPMWHMIRPAVRRAVSAYSAQSTSKRPKYMTKRTLHTKQIPTKETTLLSSAPAAPTAQGGGSSQVNFL